MKIKRRCKVCDKAFVAKRENQQFCQRKCFRKDYYRRVREANAIKKFPKFVCPFCSGHIELDFDPAKNERKWQAFICPLCGRKQGEIIDEEMDEVQISTMFDG